MKSNKSILITDLDNTLFDWVHLWYSCFGAMFSRISEISGIDVKILKEEIRAVHQRHGTSEYAFLIEEIPSLQQKYQGQELSQVFREAIDAYGVERRKELKLYPTVAETLLKIKGAGTKVIGYTESMAFYSNYRVRRLGLDGVFDAIYSPADHDLPKGLTAEQIRKYPASRYELRRTSHEHTPKDELKPNKEILLAIVRQHGFAPDQCVYVGDSLVKDVAMAKDAGIDHAWARYGLSQSTEGYQFLREVTHWTDADVQREKQISERQVKPDIELPTSFGEILDHFKFGQGTSFYDLASTPRLSPEEQKNIIEVWKSVVDVQKHFNDISLRIGGLFITLVLAVAASIGFLAEKDLKAQIGEFTLHYAALMPLVGIVGTFLFYFMDRYWYHLLLLGSVDQGALIENKYKLTIPELALTQAIGARSPFKPKRWITKFLAALVVTERSYKDSKMVHSNAKIELFYKPIVYLFAVIFVGMAVAGGILVNNRPIWKILSDRLS